MTPFKTLRVADVQALLRLALQVHEAALANRPWQRELVLGLCRITGAVTGALALLRDVDARTPWRIVEMTSVDCAPGSDGAGGDGAGGDGAGDGWAQAIRASIEDPARPDPMRAMLASTGQSIITCPRRAVVRERVWQASDNVREIRHPAGLDDCLYSLYRLGSRRQAFAILLHRRRKDASWFAGRETLLVHLLHSEMPSTLRATAHLPRLFLPGRRRPDRARTPDPRSPPGRVQREGGRRRARPLPQHRPRLRPRPLPPLRCQQQGGVDGEDCSEGERRSDGATKGGGAEVGGATRNPLSPSAPSSLCRSIASSLLPGISQRISEPSCPLPAGRSTSAISRPAKTPGGCPGLPCT